ncbi:MAG: sugar ABC transporter ATP-binding protein [Verrucomicrobia bacterium]|nr:sugar ABC transporter ATP-binding protein [Verrucomicrobiota bacterium]
MRSISKAFGPTQVLRGVDMEVRRGQIHALMGENGAGKSTLMKIAAGLISDYEGIVEVEGRQCVFNSTRDATRAGIAMIHQELSLVPELAVDENIFLGQEKVRGLFLVDRPRQKRAAQDVLRPLDFHARFDVPVSKLRIGEQQLVEIGKALVANARILIMDEPTSALSVNEAERLFQVIRRLARDGVAIVYISHRIEEVFALADLVTVLRDGKRVGTLPAAQANRREIIRLMVGRELQEWFVAPEAAATRKPIAQEVSPALEVRGLGLQNPTPSPGRPHLLAGVSFTVRRGEVLGLAGLLGAGRTEVLEVIFGLHPHTSSGEVRLDGKIVHLHHPTDAKAAGIAFVTEDRKRDGLILDAGLDRNAALTVMRLLAAYGLVVPPREQENARRTIRQLGIRASGPAQPTGTLSGGNQQKLVIGKWLRTEPRALLLDEPTRGIDVGAKADIYRLIEQLADEGLAIVLVSSELPELMFLSHRILVLREGRPTALLRKDEFVPEAILDYASPGGAVQEAFAVTKFAA